MNRRDIALAFPVMSNVVFFIYVHTLYIFRSGFNINFVIFIDVFILTFSKSINHIFQVKTLK